MLAESSRLLSQAVEFEQGSLTAAFSVQALSFPINLNSHRFKEQNDSLSSAHRLLGPFLPSSTFLQFLQQTSSKCPWSGSSQHSLLVAAWTIGLTVASGGYACHSHQHGLEAAMPEDVTKAPVASTDCIHPQGRQTSWPGAVLWTTDTNVASSSIEDCSSPSRRSNPESESFLIMSIHHCPEPGGSREAWWQGFRN